MARQAWPAAASVPMPRGRLRDPDVWIAAPGGRATLAQARALERWPDGSIRWLLVDFLADVAAGGQATYTLHDGPPPNTPGGGIRREARAETRVLDTGPLRVTVPGGVATLAELAAGPHRAQPIPPPTLHVEGAAPATPTIARVAVQTAGPVRTELLVSGRYPQRVDDGGARAIGDETALAVVARDFWQEDPKAIEVAADRLRVDLFAGRDAPLLLGTGAAKTHELWLVLVPLDRSTAPAALAAALRA